MLEKIDFYGNVLETIRDENGELWVAVRPVCEGIGVDWGSQWAKLKTDSKFMCRDITTRDSLGRYQELLCIHLNQLNGWLFSINANKVKPEIRGRLITYQKECMEVLYKHFMPRGGADLNGFMDKLTGMHQEMTEMRREVNTKLDYLAGIDLAVFGDDAPTIADLLPKAANHLGMTTLEYWGMLRKECDIASYKKLTKKILNRIRNDLGIGVFGVVDKED